MEQRTQTGKSGFTMIELLIVMAVITILALLTISAAVASDQILTSEVNSTQTTN